MAKNLFWIDLEMTGLDDQKDRILEVAAIITDMEFESKAEFHKIVHQEQSIMDLMDDWCKKTHGDSGLTELVKTGMPLEQVEKELIEFIDPHFGQSEQIVLCGNSVGNDKRFIDRYMLEFTKRLHYRIIDISSFKEIFSSKYGVEFKKKNTHRALDDIKESINELKTYLSHVKV